MKHPKHSEHQTALFPSGPCWESNGIFSDHFLRTRLQDVQTWPTEERNAELYDSLKSLWVKRHIGLSSNEETTRREFIDRVLDRLGFHYLGNLDLPVASRRRVPDYLLFADEETKDKVFNADLTVKYQAAIGILEAKTVYTPLDALSPAEKRFPHQQIRDYLDEATDARGNPYFRWSVLTNGNEWRLYCRDAHPGSYFQFTLAGPGDHFCTKEDFKMFVALFSPEAFVETDGVSLLDEIRAGAIQYQTELEQKIRKRIASVVEELANGFWAFPENGIQESELGELYDNCLIFLYRLLFVLYGEARGLLPVQLSGPNSNQRYRKSYSLQRLISRLQSQYDEDDALTQLYDDLTRLFELINGDRPAANRACGVPLYNGGLFNPQLHPRLGQWRIGDKSLSSVLKLLMLSGLPAKGMAQHQLDFGAIDYADLEVRQLGDIYEGLLGGHLAPAADGTGQLSVMGERAALQVSGTFYTPDWVVNFLIENTLSPLVEGINQDPAVLNAVSEGHRDNSFAKLLLKFTVVDPAMGSGHFLVRATEWLADRIIEHPTTELSSSLASGKGSYVREETASWRRRVVEACIYGVDLNPLAVELSKLSLWLTCIASDAPLSFLDHHLRHGNALVGARVNQLGSLPSGDASSEQTTFSLGQTFPISVQKAIQAIASIQAQDSSSLLDVKRKEMEWNEKVVASLSPFRSLADLWVAAIAGLSLTHIEYYEIGRLTEELFGETRVAKRAGTQIKDLLRLHDVQQQRLKDELKPFHWELEFPEVFYDATGEMKLNPGFDAVLGNPPYVSTQTSSDSADRNAITHLFGFIEDLYVHFDVLGFEILRSGGLFGFITSDTFFTLATKQRVRDLLQRHRLKYLVQCDPFDATVDAAMFVAEKRITGLYSKLDRFIFIQARYPNATSKPEVEIPRYLKEPTQLSPGKVNFQVGKSLYSVQHGVKGCLRIHDVAIEPYRKSLKQAFFEPTDGTIQLYNRYIRRWQDLIEEWWEFIQDSKKFAKNRSLILSYNEALKPGDLALLGLIAEGGQGMRTGNNGRFLAYLSSTRSGKLAAARQQQLAASWKSNARVGPVFKELLQKHNGRFQDTVEPLKEQFDAIRDLGLQKGEVYKIIKDDEIATESDFDKSFAFRQQELRELWATTPAVKRIYRKLRELYGDNFFEIASGLSEAVQEKHVTRKEIGLINGERYDNATNAGRTATIFNGLLDVRHWVPFRKGDPEGSRWIASEPLFIDWERESVRHLQTSDASRWQGYTFYLLEGVTWTLHANHVALKARLQPRCVFDASGSRFTTIFAGLCANSFLAILNSDLFSFIIKKFVKNTQDYEVNDLRMAPIVVPTEEERRHLSELAGLAIGARTAQIESADLSYEMINSCKHIASVLSNAPQYLQPDPQMLLLHSADNCLALVELAINWAVERLYGVEGLGPFDGF